LLGFQFEQHFCKLGFVHLAIVPLKRSSQMAGRHLEKGEEENEFVERDAAILV
jgi:hypothetical protein